MEWACARAGVSLPRAQGDSRPHTAAYDAEAHGRLYLRLKEMEARGQKLYGHLPAGVAPAVVLAAYHDPIFDHAEAYVRALRGAGVRVHYKVHYEMHGFWGGVTTDAGATSLRETATLLALLLRGGDGDGDATQSRMAPEPKKGR